MYGKLSKYEALVGSFQSQIYSLTVDFDFFNLLGCQLKVNLKNLEFPKKLYNIDLCICTLHTYLIAKTLLIAISNIMQEKMFYEKLREHYEQLKAGKWIGAVLRDNPLMEF